MVFDRFSTVWLPPPPSFDRDSDDQALDIITPSLARIKIKCAGNIAADKEWEWAIGTDGDVVH